MKVIKNQQYPNLPVWKIELSNGESYSIRETDGRLRIMGSSRGYLAVTSTGALNVLEIQTIVDND